MFLHKSLVLARLFPAIFAGCTMTAPLLGSTNKSAYPLPVYEVKVPVECASVEAAEKAELKILPLPPGKKISFSCRWDDNNLANLRMKELMHKYGYKGTFYLVSPRKTFAEKVMPQLCKDGFTIGNHSLSHRNMSQLTANGVNYEMLMARIIHETLTDQTVTAFIFPFGRIKDRFYPDSLPTIASNLRRSGSLGGPDAANARLNREPGYEFFSPAGKLVRPGDRNTSTARFDAHIKKHLPANGEIAHLTLGVHVWHSDKDFKELEKSLKKYANRPDWWYCNENEFLAYAYMRRHARVTGKKVEGSKVIFTLALPRPENLGSDIPLWAECLGKNIPIRHTIKLPQKIAAAAENGSVAGYDKLNMKIAFTAPNRLRFEAVNDGEALRDAHLILRLPPDFVEESLYFHAGTIAGKFVKEWTLTPKAAGKSAGTQLTALQVDFTRQGRKERIWVTHSVNIPETVKPAARIFCAKKEFTEQEFKILAEPGTKIDPTIFAPAVNLKNFRNTMFSVEENMRNKESLTVVMEFEGGRVMTLNGTLPADVYCNGKKLVRRRGGYKFTAPAGKCRILFSYLNSKRAVSMLQLILNPVKN